MNYEILFKECCNLAVLSVQMIHESALQLKMIPFFIGNTPTHK